MRPAVIGLLALALVACAGDGTGLDAFGNPLPQPGSGPVVSVVVSPAAPVVSVGGTAQLTAQALDAAGGVVNRSAAWAAADTLVARVNGSGLVTGAAVGTTQVSATVEGIVGTAQVTVSASASPPPTLSADVQPIFTVSCALSGCHGGGSPALGQNLGAGQAYGSIVNVPSQEVPALMRVRPGQPDSSYLVHKVQGTQGSVGGLGDQMPLGATPLTQGQINIIRAWIAAGARDN